MTFPARAVVSRSPQRPSEVVAEVAATDPEAVQRLASRAREAARSWRTSAPSTRADALNAVASRIDHAGGELVDLVVHEVGKPVTEARAEVHRAGQVLRYFAQQTMDPVGEVYGSVGDGLLLSDRRPRGLAALITPWNFPVSIPVWKLGPALAGGNGVLWKPAPAATAIALALGRLFCDVLPNGLVQVLPGDAETGAAVVIAADCVSFTGSTAVGATVVSLAAERRVAVQAEMGGHNVAVVLADADVEAVARQIVRGAFGYSGQKCTATRRVLAVGDVAHLAEALQAAARELVVGAPESADVVVGPLITEHARSLALAAVESARADGARLLHGGEALDREGWYQQPAVLDGLPPGHRLYRDEVFGPVLLVQRARDAAEAMLLANDGPYGLAASIFTRDLDRALALANGLDVGIVKVNQPTTGTEFHAPFGGNKHSSYGPRELGRAAQDFYAPVRTVSIVAAG